MLLMVGAAMLAQLGSGQLDATAKASKQHVMYVAEAQTVPAGKRAELEVRFRVDNGYHVNSHTPKSDLLIATALRLPANAGVKVQAAEYPAGKEFSFSFDPTEKVDVYSDDFVVKVPVVAAAGPHELKGELQYQACDHAACYPPRTLAVDVLFAAK